MVPLLEWTPAMVGNEIAYVFIRAVWLGFISLFTVLHEFAA